MIFESNVLFTTKKLCPGHAWTFDKRVLFFVFNGKISLSSNVSCKELLWKTFLFHKFYLNYFVVKVHQILQVFLVVSKTFFHIFKGKNQITLSSDSSFLLESYV